MGRESLFGMEQTIILVLGWQGENDEDDEDDGGTNSTFVCVCVRVYSTICTWRS
jgi:hypothetical protein